MEVDTKAVEEIYSLEQRCNKKLGKREYSLFGQLHSNGSLNVGVFDKEETLALQKIIKDRKHKGLEI